MKVFSHGKEGEDKFQTARNVRGHTLKLYEGTSRLDISEHLFSKRVIKNWNSLPHLVKVIDAELDNALKKMMEKCWEEDN